MGVGFGEGEEVNWDGEMVVVVVVVVGSFLFLVHLVALLSECSLT